MCPNLLTVPRTCLQSVKRSTNRLFPQTAPQGGAARGFRESRGSPRPYAIPFSLSLPKWVGLPQKAVWLQGCLAGALRPRPAYLVVDREGNIGSLLAEISTHLGRIPTKMRGRLDSWGRAAPPLHPRLIQSRAAGLGPSDPDSLTPRLDHAGGYVRYGVICQAWERSRGITVFMSTKQAPTASAHHNGYHRRSRADCGRPGRHAPASRPWSLSLLSFHVAAQYRVDPRLVAPALCLEPSQHVSV